MLRAVLDANIYISAALRPEGPPGRIIELLLRNAAFEVVVAPGIIDEVLQALSYPKVRRLIRRDLDTELWFEDIIVLANLVAGTRTVSGACADADDDKYLAAALEGRAAFLVTGDRQLLALAEYEGVRIVSPRAFLDILDSS